MRRTLKRAFALLLTLCLLLTGSAAARAEQAEAPADTEITKVTIQLTRTPVVLLPIAESTVRVSSANASVQSLTWYDQDGNVAAGNFEHMKYRMEIVVKADAGYTFAPGLRVYVSNSDEGLSVTVNGDTAVVTREYMAAVWSPNVVKHPGDEPVTEGSYVSYVSTALYALEMTWEFTSPDGKETVASKDAASRFPPLTVHENGEDRIVLNNVPLSLDGWTLRAVFSGAMGTVTRSRATTIRVTPNLEAAAAETPAPTATPEPAEGEPAEDEPAEGEPAELPEESPEPTPEPTPEPHVHDFSGEWKFDETSHWHECPADGARANEAAHDFTWTTISAPSRKASGEERGVCQVCGFQTVRELPYTASSKDPVNRIPLSVPLIGIPVLILACVVMQEISVIRRRRGK